MKHMLGQTTLSESRRLIQRHETNPANDDGRPARYLRRLRQERQAAQTPRLEDMPLTTNSKTRRTVILIAAALTVALGLGVHFLAAGDAAGLLADALYTVLAYFVLAFLFPAARHARVAAGALAFSAAVELFQLTDLPAQLAEAFPPSRLVLGTTFAVPDLAAYAVGAAAAWAADAAVSRRQWVRSQLE